MARLGSLLNTNSGTHTVQNGAAISDLILIVTKTSNSVSLTPPTDDNPDGLGTYTLVISALNNSSADLVSVWVRDALITNTTSTIFTHAPGVTSGGGLAVYKVSEMAIAGLAAIQQSAKEENQSSGNTPSPTFANLPKYTNPILTIVGNTSGGSSVSQTAEYTIQDNLNYSGPVQALLVAVLRAHRFETRQSIAWGSTSPTGFASLAVEVNAPDPGAFVPFFIR